MRPTIDPPKSSIGSESRLAPRSGSGRALGLVRAGLVGVLLLVALPVPAQESQSDEDRGKATLGRHTYRAYCGTCHGALGKGDGVLASVLVIPPTDLTVLAKENGGEFPAERTHKVIEGREKVKGHGDGEMPAWGPAFEQITENEEQVQAKIEQLVVFLKTIQQE